MGSISPMFNITVKTDMFVLDMHLLYINTISHQNAKSFALGPGIGHKPQRKHLTLPFATCCYQKCLRDPRRTPTLAICASLPGYTKRKLVGYGTISENSLWSCVGHVHFILFPTYNTVFGGIWALKVRYVYIRRVKCH